MSKTKYNGYLVGLSLLLTACIGSMGDRPSNDIEAFYKCRLNASKGSCEKDNMLWLLALQSPGGSGVSTQQFTLGGSVSGLSGTVVLTNGGVDKSISANDSYSFDAAINSGTSYDVTVKTQPTGQTCTVANGTGTITANVTNVDVTCAGTTGDDTTTTATKTWSHQAYLKAPNAEAEDQFGISVSISGDTIVVGAHQEDSNQTTITNGTTASADNSASNSGAAYVFKRTGTNWSHEAYLKAPNAQAIDFFAKSVSISGDTIVVGAHQEDSNQTTITNGTTVGADPGTASNSGAAYVFQRTGTNWAHEAYLKAPNAGPNDYFGWSASISGDTIVVGANEEDSNQTTITNGTTASADNSASNSGAAYVFKRTGTSWAHEAYLKAPNAGASDEFGKSVSISGDTIVVGANQEDSNQTTITNGTTVGADPGTASNSGAAYVFQRTGTNWAHEAYLKAPNAGAIDEFGKSVSISGDTIVVGANQEDSNQTTITNGTTVGADPGTASNSGAAYVFKRTGTNWSHEAYLKAPNAEADDRFGISVSISGDTIVVGAHQEDSNQTTITNGTTVGADPGTESNSGAAYVFKRTGTNWAHETYLKAPNSGAEDRFGISVSISGDTIVVGADGERSNQTTITNGTTASGNDTWIDYGAAYVFFRE